MSRPAPYPESPYHRIYTKNRSFSQLVTSFFGS